MFSFRWALNAFKQGNVCVCGLVGRGKDMFLSNVLARQKRKKAYISNVDYHIPKHEYIPLDVKALCLPCSYKNFVDGQPVKYTYPYPQKTDIIISDLGIYFPSQFCNELNKDYKGFPTFMAIHRHLADNHIHYNVQNLNRAWDKLREMSDIYIESKYCIVLFGRIVIQKLILYEKYESAVNRVPPFRCNLPLMSKNKDFARIEREKFRIANGRVEPHFMIYWRKSNYDDKFLRKFFISEVE